MQLDLAMSLVYNVADPTNPCLRPPKFPGMYGCNVWSADETDDSLAAQEQASHPLESDLKCSDHVNATEFGTSGSKTLAEENAAQRLRPCVTFVLSCAQPVQI